MSKTFIVKALWLLILCFYSSTVFSQSAESAYQTGVKLMNEKKYKEAKQYFLGAKQIGNEQLKKKCDAQIKICDNPPIPKADKPISGKPKPQPNPTELYQQGLKLMEKKSWRQAITKFSQAKQRGDKQLNEKCDEKIQECYERRIIEDNSISGPKDFKVFKDTVFYNQHGGVQQKLIPGKGYWYYYYIKDEDKYWVNVYADADQRRLYIVCHHNGTTNTRTATIRVTGIDHQGNNYDEKFVIHQEQPEEEELDYYEPEPDPDLELIHSLNFSKKGGMQVLNLPKNTQIDIPKNASTWCLKSNNKPKKGKNAFDKAKIGISNFFAKLSGKSPKTEPCKDNELVIEAKPNKTGMVRSAKIIVPRKNGYIHVSQEM